MNWAYRSIPALAYMATSPLCSDAGLDASHSATSAWVSSAFAELTHFVLSETASSITCGLATLPLEICGGLFPGKRNVGVERLG